MVALYVDGVKVGTLAEFERLLPDFRARNRRVEFRDDAGAEVGSFQPATPIPGMSPTEPETGELVGMIGWADPPAGGYGFRIAPLAYLRAMGNLFWSAIRHPLSNTTIDLSTGRVLYRT